MSVEIENAEALIKAIKEEKQPVPTRWTKEVRIFMQEKNQFSAANDYKSVLKEACDIIDQQASRIKELEAKYRWIPVSEALPRIIRTVLIYSGGYNCGLGMYGDDGWVRLDGSINLDITHWRPMDTDDLYDQALKGDK
jgi:hypothetical protein